VDVDVLNASTVNGIAHTTAAALTAQGFDVIGTGNASTQLASGDPSEILYGRSGTEAAHTLASVLGGPVTLVADPSLSGQTVSLLVAGSQLTVNAPSGVGAGPTTTTTTTIPSDVYANKQLEPWNPFPCTPGQPNQPTQATPTTAPKTVTKK
jgi:LytR cell envelope-related transcriptional attenuator